MKRQSQLLVELSRQHHGALSLALHARRAAIAGDDAVVAAAAARCVATFDAEIGAHFRVEDKTLLPLLRAAGKAELAGRLAADHAELRRLVAQLREPDAASLRAFAELLTAHVRFEEREMFAVVEVLLAP